MEAEDKEKASCISRFCSSALWQIQAVPLLLNAKADPIFVLTGRRRFNPCQSGTELAKMLIDARADQILLAAVACLRRHGACDEEHASLVELLIDARADVSSRHTLYSSTDGAKIATHTPLQTVVGNARLTRMLLAAGANVALMDAVCDNFCYEHDHEHYPDAFECARIIIEAGANVNEVMDERRDGRASIGGKHSGATLLYFCAFKGFSRRATELVIEHHADIDAATSSGQTPTIAATIQGNLRSYSCSLHTVRRTAKLRSRTDFLMLLPSKCRSRPRRHPRVASGSRHYTPSCVNVLTAERPLISFAPEPRNVWKRL